MNIDLHRKAGESELGFISRLGVAKDEGVLDMTWADLAKVFNRELREPGQEYTESAYRKKYANLRLFKGEFGAVPHDDNLNAIKEEIQKEKRKLFDQRREYNKLIAKDARFEHLTDYLVDAANKMNIDYPLLPVFQKRNVRIDKEAVLCFSDWHYGMVTDNIWNKYNVEICKQRISNCVEYAKKYITLNNISKLHIVMLGDAANGAIHVSCRVKSEEDTCDQIMEVSELMAQAISRLSECVDSVNVYSCYGNHLRTVQKKDESISTDNMEKLIPWWLEQRLKDNGKVSIIYSEYKEFTHLDVLGYNICCVHGDCFNFKDIGVITNTLFTKLYGKSIDYTISGDKHHLEEFGQYGIDSILVRSLCGSDDFAAGRHLYDKPGQTLIIFNNEYGRESTYHIPL